MKYQGIIKDNHVTIFTLHCEHATTEQAAIMETWASFIKNPMPYAPSKDSFLHIEVEELSSPFKEYLKKQLPAFVDFNKKEYTEQDVWHLAEQKMKEAWNEALDNVLKIKKSRSVIWTDYLTIGIFKSEIDKLKEI